MQGSASILIILIMLALSAFGVLAMMSAYSDYRLAQKNADRIKQHYALETEAQKEVGLLNEALAASAVTEFSLSWAAGRAEALGWETLAEEAPLVVGRDVDIGSIHLRAEVEIVPGGGPGYCRVLVWREWQDEFDYGGGLDIWDGD